MTEGNKKVVEALGNLLADSYILYLKTQNYHWNVTGPMFNTLHNLFEEQYTDLAGANDTIAERIRALGEKSPGSFAAFSKMAKVKEETGEPDAKEMLENLIKDQEVITASAQAVFEAAEAASDEPTADMAIQRMQRHQKNRWMLEAHLE